MNYYQILGISEGASLEEIKRAYRRKSMALHPDRNPSPNAAAEFMRVHAAYEALTRQPTVQTKTTPTYKPYAPPPPLTPEERAAKAKMWEELMYKKYKNVYEPPSDPTELKEWKVAFRKRMKMKAEKERANLQKEYADFEKSIFFYPALAIFSFILLCIAVIILLIAIQIIKSIFIHEEFAILEIMLLLICWFLFAQGKRLVNYASPYFFKKLRNTAA